jgi:MFS family permease
VETTVAPRGAETGRDFGLLWSGQTLSVGGTAVSSVALPVVATSVLNASTFEVALVAAAGSAAWLVFGLPSGVWVDRMPRRRLMLAMETLRGCAILSIPVAWATGVLSLAQLVTVALMVGAAGVFFDVALQTYLPAVVPPQALLRANSRLQGSESVAQVGGPALGGILVQWVGAPFALLADAASYAVSAACLTGMRRHEETLSRAPSAGLRSEMLLGLRFVRRHPVLRPLTISATLLNFSGAGLEALAVVFLVRTVQVSPGTVGVVLVGLGLGGVLGAAVASRLCDRLGTVRTLFLTVTAGPLLTLLIPLTEPGAGLLAFAVGTTSISACMVVFSIVARSYRQRVVPSSLLGKVTATVRFVSWGALPVGALVAGALGELLGNRGALWVVSASFLLSSVPLLMSPLRRTPELPSPEPVTAAPEQR